MNIRKNVEKSIGKNRPQNTQKNIEKSRKKVFTKTKKKDIISKNYTPLKVNYRIIYKRRDRLCKMENLVLKEIKRDLYDWREKILVHMFPKTFTKVYKKGIEKGFNSRM